MPTSTPPHVLAADPLVVAQDGIATVHQLMDLGCASSVIAAHSRPPGPWRRLLPRVVALQRSDPTPRQRLRGALLYAGPDALLTGPAALTLYGVTSVPAPKTDVLVTPRSAAPRGHAYVRVHPTLRPAPRVPVTALACAPLPRAVLDTVPYLPNQAALAALLAEVVERGLCDREELVAEAEATRSSRSAWVVEALQRAD
ncbi:hypothetical protein [Streptomyces ficellus]|uniref:AbiEi antitoxin C-terminal domain-containing protein n=1 Tax=Streptomyces ficellus TaxID=1977088 RepID=A0A6I6FBL4_9ACTN|nr:hypothetical protein [Streptomyces ficellus]QGV80434.1 hypothetical protein EIZ62_21005 [Streptomyces ficellus]